ncbi:target of Myb protein 1 isoform X2 [Sceloporus undulatus]|uniref:target of Myb protein 1 isoform X2 n=1 Tax=Sceloporus undulatus TaxID=8520 RepID=UPI001C4C3306|nr:target of Myb protein 1 isoform X2 [Sceloporus undulatus]
MEFLLGNPFSSPVGQRIEKATDGSLQNEDWALNMEICDIINETEEGPKDAFRAIKKRIVGNKNFHEVMLALTVLETCVKNCGHRFHVLVASQDFVEGVLVRTILPKNNPPTIVHDKVLTLIQSWADAFRSTPDLTGVVAVYEDLRRKGLEFPMTDLDMLSPIHTPQRTVYTPESSSGVNSPPAESPQVIESILHPVSLPGTPGIATDAPIAPTPDQIGKLRSELEVVNGNVKVMSEMLTELVPGQAEPSDLELLQELNRTCKAMQQRVLELIPRILNEQLTEELLIVNDNLNNIFLRHERFERLQSGQPAKEKTAENTSNLINMGSSAAPVEKEPEATNTLSSQLAGMNLGSGSVSAGLQSLNNSGKLEEEFDMFALTRGSSLAEQRKEVKYEDPLATKGLAGALDARQQNTGAIPVPQAAVMEDIEQWLSTDVENETEDPKGVTSEEFDKFLEERAKVADRLPTLPSPSAGVPPPSTSSGPHRKKDKEEDAMFAL